MSRGNKTALWAGAALALIVVLVVSAFAMGRGAHGTLYDKATTSARSGLRPISRESKPSAAVGVSSPSTRRVTNQSMHPRKGRVPVNKKEIESPKLTANFLVWIGLFLFAMFALIEHFLR